MTVVRMRTNGEHLSAHELMLGCFQQLKDLQAFAERDPVEALALQAETHMASTLELMQALALVSIAESLKRMSEFRS